MKGNSRTVPLLSKYVCTKRVENSVLNIPLPAYNQNYLRFNKVGKRVRDMLLHDYKDDYKNTRQYTHDSFCGQFSWACFAYSNISWVLCDAADTRTSPNPEPYYTRSIHPRFLDNSHRLPGYDYATAALASTYNRYHMSPKPRSDATKSSITIHFPQRPRHVSSNECIRGQKKIRHIQPQVMEACANNAKGS